MHLYGAWDLYDEKGSHTVEANEIIKKYMPYSVMLSTHKTINVYEIDEVTAYLIGWHNNKKNWYETLRPIKKNKF